MDHFHPCRLLHPFLYWLLPIPVVVAFQLGQSQETESLQLFLPQLEPSEHAEEEQAHPTACNLCKKNFWMERLCLNWLRPKEDCNLLLCGNILKYYFFKASAPFTQLLTAKNLATQLSSVRFKRREVWLEVGAEVVGNHVGGITAAHLLPAATPYHVIKTWSLITDHWTAFAIIAMF